MTAAVTSAPGAEPAYDGARIARLFRHALRDGAVHPALHLIQRHRGVQGVLDAPPPVAPPRQLEPAQRPIDATALQRQIGELPALPQVVVDLMRMLQDDGLNSVDLAARIESDPVLVARTLRLANSPFYGVPRRVGTIADAIQVLGIGAVGTLLTTAAVAGRFSAVSCAGFDYPGFWRHALATGIAARGLARAAHLNADLSFAAGLLHDIGRLVLATSFPVELAQAIGHGRAADLPLCAAEQAVLGCDHASVGAALAERWKLPAAVAAAIRDHHQPRQALRQASAVLSDVVRVADALVHALDLTRDAGEYVPALSAIDWEGVAVADDALIDVLLQTEGGVAELCQALAL